MANISWVCAAGFPFPDDINNTKPAPATKGIVNNAMRMNTSISSFFER
jgi:hypothetical protein